MITKPLNWLAFLFCFLLIAAAEFVYADTIPATSSTSTVPATTRYYVSVIARPAGTWYADKPTACTQQGAYHDTYSGVPGYHGWADDISNGQCKFWKASDGSGIGWKPYVSQLACAQGTLSGSNCTITTYSCPAGYTGPDANNQCTLTAPTCDLAVGTQLYSGYYDVGTSPTGHPPSTICKNHCVGVGYTSGPDYTAMTNGVKHYYYTGYYAVDPGTPQQNYCATDTPTQDVSNSTSAPSNTCPAGRAVGYVNGIAVCYDQPTPTTSTPPISSDKKVETTTAPDGTKTETTTETAPDGSKTVTVVVTPPAGSTAPQTTTTSKTPPADPVAAKSFCEQNPNEPVCKANKSECELHPGTVGCMTPGDIPAAEPLSDKTISPSYSTVAIASNYSCPAVVNVDMHGHMVQVDYDWLCQYAQRFRYLVIAAAMLAAAFIVVTGVKREEGI